MVIYNNGLQYLPNEYRVFPGAGQWDHIVHLNEPAKAGSHICIERDGIALHIVLVTDTAHFVVNPGYIPGCIGMLHFGMLTVGLDVLAEDGETDGAVI